MTWEERERRGKCKGFPVFNSWDDFMSIFAVVFFSGASGKRWRNLANRIRILYVYSFILCNLMLHPLIWKKIINCLSYSYHMPSLQHHKSVWDWLDSLNTVPHRTALSTTHGSICLIFCEKTYVLIPWWWKKYIKSSPVSIHSLLMETCYYHKSW